MHLLCLYRDHNYRWHWAGVWLELHSVHWRSKRAQCVRFIFPEMSVFENLRKE
jgi:hypothetical protein